MLFTNLIRKWCIVTLTLHLLEKSFFLHLIVKICIWYNNNKNLIYGAMSKIAHISRNSRSTKSYLHFSLCSIRVVLTQNFLVIVKPLNKLLRNLDIALQLIIIRAKVHRHQVKFVKLTKKRSNRVIRSPLILGFMLDKFKYVAKFSPSEFVLQTAIGQSIHELWPLLDFQPEMLKKNKLFTHEFHVFTQFTLAILQKSITPHSFYFLIMEFYSANYRVVFSLYVFIKKFFSSGLYQPSTANHKTPFIHDLCSQWTQ